MVVKAQDRTCEHRCDKKKEKISQTPSTSKSQFRICGVNFGKIKIFVFMVMKAQVRNCRVNFEKNENFCFYGPKATGPDL